MEAKEKAEELLSRFVSINLSQVNDLVDGIRIRLAKESALICVDEIINAIANDQPDDPEHQEMYENFWNEVKSELNKPHLPKHGDKN